MQEFNFASEFHRAVLEHGDDMAIMDEHQSVTFRTLETLSISFALRMRSFGVGQESTVALEAGDPLVIVASVLACAYLGCRWVFDGEEFRNHQPFQPTHRFTTEAPAKDVPGTVQIDASWAQPPEGYDPGAPLRFLGYRSPERGYLVFPSSGTTGTPKFIELSYENVFRRIQATAVEYQGRQSRCAFLFPLQSAPSLNRAMSALMCGWGLVQSGDPAFWKKAGVSHVYGSPSQVSRIVKGAALPGKFEKVLVGGAGLSDEFARILSQSFEAVVNTYGSTEANMVLQNQKLIAADGAVTTKTRWLDSEVEIVDRDDSPVTRGQEGYVRIRNAYLFPGYLNNPQAEQKALRHGWFYPGDMGYLTEEGDFIVTGRADDVFNIGGFKVNAMLIDFVLQSIEGIEDAACFLMPDEVGSQELVAYVELAGDVAPHEVLDEARLALLVKLGQGAVPKKIFEIDAVPRNANGKANRSACIELATKARMLGGGATAN